jgi:mycothiol system anti-sigma-R factor
MNVISFEQNACKRIKAQLDSYLSGELAGETCREVSAHLEGCSACARELEARSVIKSRLQTAVGREEVPLELRERIQRSIRKNSFENFRPWMLAAAAALLLAAGAWGVVRYWDAPRDSEQPYRASLAAKDAEILQVGLRDHVHCAVESKMADRLFTPEQMSQSLGPDYAGLVQLVKARAPGDYRVVVGHRCRAKGRQFVHLVLRNRERVLSLALTKKEGEAFSGENLAGLLEASGVRLCAERLEGYEVAAFETRDHLVFVVSDLVKEENLQIAAGFAPTVRDFLVKLEG